MDHCVISALNISNLSHVPLTHEVSIKDFTLFPADHRCGLAGGGVCIRLRVMSLTVKLLRLDVQLRVSYIASCYILYLT